MYVHVCLDAVCTSGYRQTLRFTSAASVHAAVESNGWFILSFPRVVFFYDALNCSSAASSDLPFPTNLPVMRLGIFKGIWMAQEADGVKQERSTRSLLALYPLNSDLLYRVAMS